MKFGRMNRLRIDRIDGEGAWLKGNDEPILLRRREVPAGAGSGDFLEVFVYRGGDDAPVATLRRPRAQLGEFALLKVRAIKEIGTFLDLGLDKDLFVPFAEQPKRMQEGQRYLVRVCLDDRRRLVGTARIDRCLETENIDLAEGEEVSLIIWEFTDLGAKVIINDLYGGLLYRDEIEPLRRGARVRGYVKRIREDGKIDVTLQRTGAAGAEDARRKLQEVLRRQGFLPLHDDSSPEEVRRLLGMSKKSFKKALGGLYRQGLLEMSDEGIHYREGEV